MDKRKQLHQEWEVTSSWPSCKRTDLSTALSSSNEVNANCSRLTCVGLPCQSLLRFSICFNVYPSSSSHAPEKRSSCPNRAGSHSSFIIDDFTFMFCNYILVYSPIAFDKWVYFITMSHHSQIKVFIIILSFEKGFINL